MIEMTKVLIKRTHLNNQLGKADYNNEYQPRHYQLVVYIDVFNDSLIFTSSIALVRIFFCEGRGPDNDNLISDFQAITLHIIAKKF